MATRTKVGQAFAVSPAAAFRLVEPMIRHRRRKAVPHLEALLEGIDSRIREDPKRALELANRAVSLVSEALLNPKGPSRELHPDWRDLKALSMAVKGSALSYDGAEKRAVDIFEGLLARGGLSSWVRGSVLARMAIALMNLKRWREADLSANKAVLIYECAERKRAERKRAERKRAKTPPRPFACLPMALVIRAIVGLTRFEYAAADQAHLGQVLHDSQRAADLADRSRYQDLKWVARTTNARAVAIGSFFGVDWYPVEVPPVPQASAWWPKARWTEALASCARYKRLTAAGERAFYEGRDAFEERGLVDEGVQLTLDLQWWLLASGQRLRAVAESAWIEHHLHALRFDHDVVVAWIDAIRQKTLSTTLVETVYSEVRGLRNVGLPPA